MSKYKGPKLKIIKKLGILPGLTKKVKINKINFDIKLKQISLSDNYKIQLFEKQKLCYNYNISNNKLKNYYFLAKKKLGFKENILLNLLESRLDNIVFRLGFSTTIVEARQFINHNHILVNNKIINISSYICKLNDIISLKSNSKIVKLIDKNIVKKSETEKLIQQNLKKLNFDTFNFKSCIPSYLLINKEKYTGKINSSIDSTMSLLKINYLKILEYYSR